MSSNNQSWAVYIWRSTEDQSDEHQREDIRNWLEYNDLSIGECEVYAEQGSGSNDNRRGFRQLISDIENGDYTDVIVWEISRVARHGLMAQRFFDACEEAEATIHVTNGSVREVRPDGTGRMVAGIIAEVAAEERRVLIRRTKSGQRRAREQDGKWLGQVPAGFVRIDGYLKPNLDPDYDTGETGFLDVVEALEAVEAGESYNKTASRRPNITRQTLSNIHQDDERRAWYLNLEADDERVQDAVTEVDA